MLISSRKDRRFLSAALTAVLFFSACSQIKPPEPEAYFSKTEPPAKQELRWTNGKLPKTFDPALAAAAPEIDIARAMFDGLTDLDPKTLEAVPALAENWTSENNGKVWTFYLREDAKWSNGERVTAEDFVRSWKRLVHLGEKVPHRNLLLNIEGLSRTSLRRSGQPDGEPGLMNGDPAGRIVPAAQETATPVQPDERSAETETEASPSPRTKAESEAPIGITAVNETELRISLINPDNEFPKLVAHPMFRPVQKDLPETGSEKQAAQIVTSGPFKLASIGAEGLMLDRFESYWDTESVKLERVKIIPLPTAEKALEAYRNGSVDVVTNAEFSPAALKLLEPYEDFRRTTFAALNFYELNINKAPFSDRRVREALAIAIERESLTEGELGGSTRPALSFTPFPRSADSKLTQDKDKATQLIEDAGFPEGKGFPVIRLLINRNDIQQRIARSIARMWKQNLNIETEIIVKEPADLAAAKAAGDFDAIRRGAVISTPDEAAILMALFYSDAADQEPGVDLNKNGRSEFSPLAGNQTSSSPEAANGGSERSGRTEPIPLKLTEDRAIYELRGIPLYFPTSYSLVKPYVIGFDPNGLDAPMLKRVEIDSDWRNK